MFIKPCLNNFGRFVTDIAVEDTELEEGEV